MCACACVCICVYVCMCACVYIYVMAQGQTSDYTWTQDAKQVKVTVTCDADTSGEDVLCVIKPSLLSLSVKVQCVAVWCSVLQCGTVCCRYMNGSSPIQVEAQMCPSFSPSVSRCGLLQVVAACCSVLHTCALPQTFSTRVLSLFLSRCSVLQCVVLCCSVLQRVAACCNVLQCVTV